MPKLGRRLGRRRGSADKSRRLERTLYCRDADVTSPVEMISNLAPFGLFGDIQREQIIVITELVAVHGDTATPSSSRKLCNAVRTQVLMVPSGCPILTDISDWDRPSK